MSSLFDVPVHLAMVLALAVSGAESGDVRPPDTQPRQFASEGPYRFSEQIWLEALQTGAGGAELAIYKDVIFRTGSKRYYVPAETYRKKVFTLRRDPDIAALVAFNFARENARLLSPRLARPVTAADLYVAHVLGRDAALALIPAAEGIPTAAVTAVVPQLAAVGPALLGKRRRPMTVVDLYRRLTRSFDVTKAETVTRKRIASQSTPAAANLRGGLIDHTSSAWLPLKSHLVWATEVRASP